MYAISVVESLIKHVIILYCLHCIYAAFKNEIVTAVFSLHLGFQYLYLNINSSITL